MHRPHRPNSFWLVSGLIGAFVLGTTSTGRQVWAEILASLPPMPGTAAAIIVPARPQVLVVTGKGGDEFTVAATVNPHGYRVRVARTAAGGRSILQSDASRIGVVVVDMGLAGAQRVIGLTRSLAPQAKLIELDPNHRASDVSVPLLRAI
jgi:hypothetical protein